jgi:hypothetical protein
MTKVSATGMSLRLLLLSGFVLALAGVVIARNDSIAMALGWTMAAGACLSIAGICVRLITSARHH